MLLKCTNFGLITVIFHLLTILCLDADRYLCHYSDLPSDS